MALLSDWETAAKTQPSPVRHLAAGACFVVRERIAQGFTFAQARDYVVARPDTRKALNDAQDLGFTVSGSVVGVSDFAALTGP
jgi:hypothetical protein